MKPGYTTTEFWITFITQILNALVQSGLVGDGTQLVKALGFAAATLTAVVYALTRAHVKGKDADAKAGETLGPDPQSGFVLPEFLVAIAMVIFVGYAVLLIGSAGCATVQGAAKHAAGDIVDCAAPKMLDRSSELTSVLERSLPAVLSDTGKVDRAGFKSLTAGLMSDAAGCAIATAIKHLSAPRDQGAPFASPLTVDAADLQRSWAEVDRDQFGGRTFALGGS